MNRSRGRQAISALSLILGFLGGTAIQGWAMSIDPGFDLFHTPDGTAFVPIPNIGNVPLMSRPIPGLGNTDTIVQRKTGLAAGGTGLIDTELVALSLQSVNPINMSGSFFDVFMTINNPGFAGLPQTTGLSPSLGGMTINAHDDQAGGGTFVDSFFDVFVEIDLVPVGGGTTKSFFDVFAELTNGQGTWSHTPPPGYPETRQFPAGNFYPGTVNHTGPHPTVVPAVPEPASVILLISGLALVAATGKRKAAA